MARIRISVGKFLLKWKMQCCTDTTFLRIIQHIQLPQEPYVTGLGFRSFLSTNFKKGNTALSCSLSLLSIVATLYSKPELQ